MQNELSEPQSRTRKPHDFDNLATLFVEHLSEEDRYPLYHAGTFYLYDGTRYVEEPDLDNAIRTFFKRTKRPQSNNVIGNVKPIVQNIAYRPVTKYGPCMPFYLGCEAFPKSTNIIAYQNGLLDVERYLAGDATLIPHTPKWASTVSLPYAFDPAATCPSWLTFLDEVFDGDADRIGLQQEWCGYLLAHDISQHKLMVKTGVPRAGKGTSMRIEAALVGTENSTGYNLHSLAERFGLSQLAGKLVAFVGEVNLANSREKYRILETLNSIVGGDPVSVEEKHNPVCRSLTLPTRFVLACNEMPGFVDPSGALAARLLILDFNRSFEGREDRLLDEKLLAELSGISKWALDGYVRLKQNGRFTETERQRSLVNRFRRESSDVLGFVQDCLVVEKRLNPGNLVGVETTDKPLWLSQAHLFNAYNDWCSDNGKLTTNTAWLGKNLRAIMPTLDYDKHRKVYPGVYLLNLYRTGSLPGSLP